MSGPWEKYKSDSGPWTKYSTSDKQAVDQFASFPEVSAVLNSNKSKLGKTWDMLKVPAQMSSRGLGYIANAIPKPEPTGNLPMDLLKGYPRIEAEMAQEAAPGFINRAAFVTGGASKALGLAGKALAPIGRGIASGLEDWAGIRPEGALGEAIKDSGLIFSRGVLKAKPLYEAGKAELSEGTNIFKGMYKPEKIVDTAQEYLSKGGKLEPAEALMYRKAIDSLAKSGRYVKDELFSMRKTADAMAKASENISEADRLHWRGLQAQSLRSLFPKNVGGRASPFKVAEGLALAHMGPVGKALSVLFSPVALGLGATGLGVAGRVASNPGSAVAVQQLLNKLIQSSQSSQSSR